MGWRSGVAIVVVSPFIVPLSAWSPNKDRLPINPSDQELVQGCQADAVGKNKEQTMLAKSTNK